MFSFGGSGGGIDFGGLTGGLGLGGFGGGSGRGSNVSSNPTLEDFGIDAFKEKLEEVNPSFFGADYGSRLLHGRALGLDNTDRMFDKYAQSRFNIFESGAQQQRENMSANLQRMGLGNSSVGLNQLSNIDSSLSQQRESLGSELGLQQLQRRDQALLDAASMKELEFGATTVGLENLLAMPTLEIGRLAAVNAGKVPEDKSGGGLLGGLLGGLF